MTNQEKLEAGAYISKACATGNPDLPDTHNCLGEDGLLICECSCHKAE